MLGPVRNIRDMIPDGGSTGAESRGEEGDMG